MVVKARINREKIGMTAPRAQIPYLGVGAF